MPEPTVPVPVSLIQRILVNDDELDASAAEDELRALLSQPTPTAEPVCGGAATNCNHRFWPPVHTMACPVGRAQNQPDAAPPSIADMVPGTTFTGTTQQGFTQRFERVSRGRVKAENGTLWSLLDYRGRDRIDPSTIRDVQIPREAIDE